MSIKRPFFLSALSFAVAFVLGSTINFLWPLTPDTLAANGGQAANALSQLSWVLGIIGFVAFVIGVWNKSNE